MSIDMLSGMLAPGVPKLPATSILWTLVVFRLGEARYFAPLKRWRIPAADGYNSNAVRNENLMKHSAIIEPRRRLSAAVSKLDKRARLTL